MNVPPAIIDALYCDVCKCHSDRVQHPTVEPPFGKPSVDINY